MAGTKKRILVMCPGNAVTGGPEVLHQLVHTLRRQGQDAAICYYPIETSFTVPDSYRGYNVVVDQFVDRADQIVVIPEVATKLADELRLSQGLVWWLSVDNFYGRTGQGTLHDVIGHMLAVFRSRRKTLAELRHFGHLAQSTYALDFLARNGFEAALLTDYLADEHFSTEAASKDRRNAIAYNPRKGAPVVARLRRALQHVEFIPIVGMTKEKVAELLRSVKVYVDFGHHPGKDRLPREAAMAGACVITGVRGSAAFAEDVAIPDAFKLDENSPHLAVEFGDLVRSIFADFDGQSARFDAYRKAIREEKAVFEKQVRELFSDR